MLLACAVGLAAAASADGALAAPPSADGALAAPPPRAALDQFVCQRAANVLNRAISIQAVMRPVSGTQRMGLKFQLLRKTHRARSFVDVSFGSLGKWVYPTDPPTLGQRPDDVWQYTRLVAKLPGPAVYRFRVSFRWTGTGGSVLQLTSLLSPKCAQP